MWCAGDVAGLLIFALHVSPPTEFACEFMPKSKSTRNKGHRFQESLVMHKPAFPHRPGPAACAKHPLMASALRGIGISSTTGSTKAPPPTTPAVSSSPDVFSATHRSFRK